MTDQQGALARLDELQRGDLEDLAPRQFRVVRPVDGGEVLALGQSRGAVTALEQSRASAVKLVLHEPGEALEEVHLVSGDLQGARLDAGDHP